MDQQRRDFLVFCALFLRTKRESKINRVNLFLLYSAVLRSRHTLSHTLCVSPHKFPFKVLWFRRFSFIQFRCHNIEFNFFRNILFFFVFVLIIIFHRAHTTEEEGIIFKKKSVCTHDDDAKTTMTMTTARFAVCYSLPRTLSLCPCVRVSNTNECHAHARATEIEKQQNRP